MMNMCVLLVRALLNNRIASIHTTFFRRVLLVSLFVLAITAAAFGPTQVSEAQGATPAKPTNLTALPGDKDAREQITLVSTPKLALPATRRARWQAPCGKSGSDYPIRDVAGRCRNVRGGPC